MEQEQDFMKLLVIGILSSLILSGCSDTGDYYSIRSYHYKNETNYDISIEQWKRNHNKVFDLDPSDSIIFELEFLGDGVGYCAINGIQQSLSPCELFGSDSLKIMFDNERILILNPFDSINDSIEEGDIRGNIDIYSVEINGYNRTHRYSFTQKDYDQATPIDNQ